MNGVAGSSPFASAVTCRVNPAQLEYPWRCARSRRADASDTPFTVAIPCALPS
jgi:hypothetical protein